MASKSPTLHQLTLSIESTCTRDFRVPDTCPKIRDARLPAGGSLGVVLPDDRPVSAQDAGCLRYRATHVQDIDRQRVATVSDGP
jgi:hypothetical protein